MKFQIPIACSAVVKHHVLNSIGRDQLPINEHNKFGFFIKLCLVHPNEIVSQSWNVKILESYKEELHCILNASDVKYKMMVVHPRKQIDFNEWVKMDIRDQSNQHIKRCVDKGLQIKEAIELFWDDYNFTPELYSFDAMKKNFQRYRLRISA